MYNPDRYSIMIKYGANGNWLSVILLKIEIVILASAYLL